MMEFRPELVLLREMVAARVRRGWTQGELAWRMGTTQSAIARMELGRHSPSVKTLKKLADVTGSQLVVKLGEVGASFPRRGLEILNLV
jgi:transcriptional regulator with XRE-family HTH domain